MIHSDINWATENSTSYTIFKFSSYYKLSWSPPTLTQNCLIFFSIYAICKLKCLINLFQILFSNFTSWYSYVIALLKL